MTGTGSFMWLKNDATRQVAVQYAVCLMLLLVACFGASARPAIDAPPVFSNGTHQTLNMCENAAATPINTELSIIDSDAGQTETWTLTTGPLHGSVTGFPVSAISSGGSLTPSWLEYVPAAGFAGVDSFIVQVSDGAVSATTIIVVSVNPVPTLSSPLTPPAICDQSVFSYIPLSTAPAATYAWHRVFVPGISNATASGTGNPSEALYNITNNDVAVTYIFTVNAGGCSSQSNVVLTVHPTPRLSGSLTDTICSGSTFSFVASGPVPGTTFAWNRAVVPGILPAVAASGGDTISESLSNSTTGILTAVYSFSLTANGCSSVRNVVLAVYPQYSTVPITVRPDAGVCQGTQCMNFGAATTGAYTWSAVNASIVSVGVSGQFCLVSFPDAGEATVTLTIGSGAMCAAANAYTVAIGGMASVPGNVIYYNYHFVLQDNTQDTYQWGYDDVATLDSSLLPGETYQSYLNPVPDFANKYYWVISGKDGCVQKSYFNSPLLAGSVTSVSSTGQLSISPNPAEKLLHLSLDGEPAKGDIVVIADAAGHITHQVQIAERLVTFDVSEYPAGVYLVSYFKNGIRMTTSRFVKIRD